MKTGEEFFGFGVVGGEFEGALDFGAGERGFFLFEVDACEGYVNYGVVTGLQRGLELQDGFIQFALAAGDIRQPAVRGSVCTVES